MSYNVFGGTLSPTQSTTKRCVLIHIQIIYQLLEQVQLLVGELRRQLGNSTVQLTHLHITRTFSINIPVVYAGKLTKQLVHTNNTELYNTENFIRKYRQLNTQ